MEELNEKNPLHEEINAYSLNCMIDGERQMSTRELKRFAEDLMNEVSGRCMNLGAKDIGHIKAYIDYETGFIHADTLGDPSDVVVSGKDGEPSGRFRLVLNSVIYGLPEEDVRKANEEAIDDLFSRYGLKILRDIDYSKPLQILRRRDI